MSHSHSGSMNMTGDAAAACKMEMLWNWNVVDSCFLASSWHVTNNVMFAASCIGAALLVVSLEFCRRVSREYDSLIMRQWQRRNVVQQRIQKAKQAEYCELVEITTLNSTTVFRATALQQLIRSIIHAITIGLAYIVMLIVMQFNGYIFISVVLGAGIGKFLCDWLVIRLTDVFTEDLVSSKTTDLEGASACCA